MSYPDKRQKLDADSGLDKGDDITLLFDDDTSLKSSKRVLEAASSVLKTALNDCEHDCSLRLPQTSSEVWTFILQYIDAKDPPSNISEEIGQMSTEEIIEVLKQCQKYEIKSLKRRIDEVIAKDFELVDPFGRSNTGYIHIRPRDRGFTALGEFDLPKTEGAVARYLIRVLKKNEELYKEHVSNKKENKLHGFQVSVRLINRFLEAMYRAGHSRLLYLYTRELMEDRSIIPREAIHEQREIASRKRDMSYALRQDCEIQ